MEILQKFKAYLLALKPTPSQITVKNYCLDVKHFLVWLQTKDLEAKLVTNADIHDFLEEKKNTFSTRTLERHTSSLRKFYQFLKLSGMIANSPFDEAVHASVITDPYRLREFKDYLYVYNAASLTIKNYIIDVKQFLRWAEVVLHAAGTLSLGSGNVLPYVTNELVEQYRDRLASEHVFSYTSINRKLSSLRKYFAWAKEQKLLTEQSGFQINPNGIANIVSTSEEHLPKSTTTQAPAEVREHDADSTPKQIEVKPTRYSKFPPLRLAQKITKGINYLVEGVVITPLTHAALQAQKAVWVLRGKPLFTKKAAGFSQVLMQTSAVKNISKAIYSPESISLASFPWYKKIIHIARYRRPNWYKRYQSYAFVRYFNMAVLIIFATAIGFGIYNNFVQKPTSGQHLLAAAQPNRILSFQGRLTDSNSNPITTATNLRFGIYTDATATGSALLWQEVDNVTPDSNGVFSVLLGKNSTIQQSLFANNANLYLGITVGTTPELTPRQQLATVAYATNAETLQGLPPITQAGAGTQNVVLALDSTGNLTIGAASKFQTVGGAFTLSGDTLALNTNAGTNGNITLTPDGTGFIDLQKPLVNTTNNGNIPSAKGSVEVDDTLAILATSSGIPAVTINQNGSGVLLTASAGGISKFTVASSGAITDANYTTSGGIFYADSTGTLFQTTTGTNGECLTSTGGGAPTWGTCGSGGTGTTYWTLANGALYPVNTTLDVLFGGTSSSSANFAFINNAGGTPTASVSGNLTLNSNGAIQTTNNRSLTIGGNSTGNITLSPLNGAGTVTIARLATGVVHSTGGVLSSSNVNLASEVTGTLPLSNGGTGASLTGDQGGIVYYSSNTSLATLAHSSTSGQCLTSGGTGAPSWTNCASAAGVVNYWTLANGSLYPVNTTLDVFFGGTSTASANFAFLNNASGTPTASISGNLTLNSAGVIQTTNNRPLTLGSTTTGAIQLSPEGTTGLYVSTSGNVGVGTTTPVVPLDVAGAASISSSLTFKAGAAVIQATADNTLTLGGNTTGAVSFGSNVASNILPAATNTYDLGSSSLQWNNIYENNLFTSGTYAGFWQLSNGALAPTNITNDLLVGGTATSTAKFQIFANTGNATTAGTLTFNGSGNLIQTTNNQGLTIGGNTTGNITLSPLAGIAGSTLTVNAVNINTTESTVNLLNTTAATINFGGAATAVNIGNSAGTTTFAGNIDSTKATLTFLPTPTIVNVGSSGQTDNLLGNVALGSSQSNTVTPNGLFNGDIIPSGNGVINLGSSTHYYNTVYANNFVAPISGGTSGYWSLANDVIYPNNTYFDLAIGGTSTASADFQVYSENVGNIVAGTATTSGMLSFRNANTSINLLNNANLNIQRSVGGDTGLTSAFYIQAGTGNIGVGTTNPSSFALQTAGNVGPNANNQYDLGSASLEWNNLYVKNIITTGTTAGFWQLSSGVIAPSNITNDLAIGGTATSTAKFQVFGLTGNATTAGNLTFAGGSANNVIAARDNAGLTIGDSQTGNIVFTGNGNVGVGTANPTSFALQVAGNVGPNANNQYDLGSSILAWRNVYANNVILPTSGGIGGYWQLNNGAVAPTNITNDVLVGGTSTTSAKFAILNMASGTPTASVSSGLNGTGMYFDANGNIQAVRNETITLGGNTTGAVSFGSNVASNILPKTTNTYDLGSASLQWNNIYGNNIYSNGQLLTSFWQLNSGVLSPINITNDLAIGGTATSTAKFQVFGLTGNATTAGNLTFAGGSANNVIAARDNAGLTIGDSQTGNIVFTGNGNVGVGTANPVAKLQVNANSGSVFIGDNTNTTAYTNVNSQAQFGYNSTGYATVQAAASKGIQLNVNNNTFGGGTAVTIDTNGFVAIGNTLEGNGALVVNQTNVSGLGDIIAASSSGATQFKVSNAGVVTGSSFVDLQNSSYYLDPASAADSLLVAGTVGVGTTTPLYLSGLDIEKGSLGNAAAVVNQLSSGPIFTASASGTTRFTIANDGTLTATKYVTQGGVLYTSDTNGTIAQTAQGAIHTVLHGNGTGAPTFSAVDLAADVTGVLPLTNGGTGANLTGDQGGIVYFNTNTTLATLAHSSTAGQCLVSGGLSAPYWTNCSNASSNWWSMNNGALYPINTTLDFLIGGTATNTAKFSVLNMSGTGTPTASVSSGLNGNGIYMTADGTLQTTNNQGLTIGGNTTGNITLAPLNSAAGSAIHANAATIDDSFATANLFGTPTTLTFASGATSLTVGNSAGTTTFAGNIDSTKATLAFLATPTIVNVGSSSQTDNLLGNVALGTNQSNTITPNGLMNADLIPTGNGAINLGSSTHYYNTVYANNFVAPVSGGTSGFWSLANDVIYPVNTYFDLAIGGTSTASADWQVFSENVGSIVAGTATSSGNLSFRNAATKINLLNGAALDLQSSLGGDTGLASILHIANNGDTTQTGNYTLSGNLAVNGGTISTTQTTASLFESGATTINFGTTATTGINIGNASGSNLIRGNLTLGSSISNTIDPVAYFSNHLIPSVTNSYDLGTSTLAWRNLYLSGTYGGFVQRNLGVISPTNITDDLAIGGTSTASAKFQIFGNTINGEPAGTASTSGQLTFNTSSHINLLNNAGLGFYNSVGGDSGLAATPALYIANTTRIGLGTTSPASALSINYDNSSTADLSVGTGSNATNFIALSGGRGQVGYSLNSAGNTIIQGNSNHGIQFLVSSAGTFGTGTTALSISGNGLGTVGVGTTLQGNAALAVNQQDLSGLGDIFTASASGTPLFTIANDGSIKNSLVPNLIGATGIDTLYNLGASTAEWDTLYVRQIVTPSTGGLAGYWQLSSGGVLAPANLTNDLAVGGVATSSAVWQVFANSYNNGSFTVPAGTATTSGNLVFRGTPGSQTAFQSDILNGGSLGFYTSAGGDAGITTSKPSVYIASSGNVGIGTNSPSNTLQVAGDFQVGKDATSWGVSGYSYRRQVSVNNTSGGALTNYQVKLVVDTATLISAGKMLSSCNDIRFTDTDGTTNLNYWIENGCNTHHTTIWVKVPTIGYPSKTIYMYYGNGSATAASSTTGTFTDAISGVQAAYRLDEPTYDPIQDYSTNGNVATASGTTVETGTNAKFNNARYFNGTSDYIAASNSASLQQVSPMALGAWFKTTTTTTDSIIVRHASLATSSNQYTISLNINPSETGGGTGKVGAQYYNGTASYTSANDYLSFSSSTTLNDGKWHYVVLIITGSIPTATITLYVDGVAQTSTTINSGTLGAPNGQFDIGDGAPDGFNSSHRGFFSGTIDEVREYNAALTPTQITELYGNGGNNYGYVTTNYPQTELVAAYTATAPTTYLNPEQSALQTIPTLFAQNTTGNVALGTLSVASTSARLTVAGDIKSGLYDTTAWGSNFSGYSYRAQVNVDNTKGTTDLTNYIVQLTTNTAAPISNGKMRSDCGDIRLADADGNTNLSYWIEPGTCNTSATVINVKVPTIPGSASKNIYLYYGNPSVTTTSSTSIFTATIPNVTASYRFDETTAGSYADYSGNNYTATATSSGVIGGVYNNAVHFNNTNSATNQFVITPNLGTLSTAFSLSLWFNAQSQNGTIVNELGQAQVNNTYHQALLSLVNGNVYMQVWQLGCVNIGTMKPGWNHVVITANGTTQTGYLNGVLGGTSSTGTRTDPTNIYFGIGGNDTTNCGGGVYGFTGSVDAFTFFNGLALSSTQVGYLYNNYGYSTTNSAGNQYIRPFSNPEPVTTVNSEEDPSQVDPTLYVSNEFGRVGIGTANPQTNLDIVGTPANTVGYVGLQLSDQAAGGRQFMLTSTDNGNGIGGGNFGIFDRTAGAYRLVINSSGQVGIGTTSPAYSLDVNGSIRAGAFYDQQNTAYYLDPAATGTSLTTAGGAGIGTSAPSTFFQVGNGGNTKSSIYSTDSNYGQLQIGNPNSGAEASIGFISGVTAFGDAPTSVNGNASVWTMGVAAFSAGTGNFGIGNANHGNVMTLLSGGSVGIGTTTPGSDVTMTGGLTVNQGAANGTGFEVWNNGTGAFALNAGDNVAGDVTMYDKVGGNYHTDLELRNGNVGIGTTNPGQQLDLSGRLQLTGSGLNGDPTIYGASGSNWTRIGGAAGIALWGNGNVWSNNAPDAFISTYPNNVVTAACSGGPKTPTYYAFYGCASIYTTGTYQSSDERVKTDITPIASSSALAAVMQLQGVNFVFDNMKTPGFSMYNFPAGQQIGLIAQQVQQIEPDLVTGTATDSAPMGVNYSALTGLLVPAIQAQQFEIASNSAALANLQLTVTGNIAVTPASTSTDFTIPQYYSLTDVLGNPIKQMGALAELVVGNLRAGIISTQQLFTNSLVIATNNVSIAGKSLDQYIIGVVQNALNSGIFSTPTLSPIAEVNQLHTDLISPLASDSAIALDLTGSKFTIRNNASGSAVATIDNAGNATFSGTLNSQNLAVNGDATVSGTLYANNIKANSIEGLQEVVSTLSAQNITNVTNIYFATPSGTPASGNFATGSNASSTENFGVLAASTSGSLTPYMGYTNIASYSGFLAYVPNLSANAGTFNQSLVSLGATSLSDTTITGQLSIGTQLTLANNSINVLGSSLEIQPLRQGGVNFEGGLLAIDTDGNLTVNGNAVFSKTLAANIISPISNNQDLTVQLGQNPTATGAALATSNLTVENASGSGVFAINQLGDVVASGTATIGKLNFNFVQPALALSATEVVATGSAGTATIAAHQTEVTIDNTLVTSKSLIYITPVGQSTATPYLLRQVNGTSFTVGIPVQQLNGTTFNWLIVN